MMTEPDSDAGPPADPTAARVSARLQQRICAAAEAAGGRLPFARYMEMALYEPGLGYYVAGARKLGSDGDFVTAPELSSLFGRCLAVPCREVLDGLDGGDLLEFGAGSGALAAELLGTLAERGPLPESYLILEPSPELAERQRRTLAEHVPGLLPRVRWLSSLPRGFRGAVIANEVLDAMPVHRFRIAADGAIEEVFVHCSGGGLAETAAPAASAGLTEAVQRLHAAGLARTPGYASEVNLRLGPWTDAVAGVLQAGLLLVIDYGYPRAEYYLPERDRGTLMGHSRHRAYADPYARVGLQDIGAHVDFTALAEAGTAAGLRLEGYTTQAHFLIGCGIDALIGEAAGSEPAATLELAAGAKQLLLPSAMGERFQVMGLSRGLAEDFAASGFGVRDLRQRL